MLDNLQLIPGEAFDMLDHIFSHLINKLDEICHFLFIPRGNKKYNIEAVNYLIEYIKQEDDIPPLIKAALLSDPNGILEKFKNSHDISNIATKYLLPVSLSVDSTEEQLFLMNITKNISNESNDMLSDNLLTE